MKITLSDLRTIIGTFMAYDKHMNLVLGDAEEFRTVSDRSPCPRATHEFMGKARTPLCVLGAQHLPARVLCGRQTYFWRDEENSLNNHLSGLRLRRCC